MDQVVLIIEAIPGTSLLHGNGGKELWKRKKPGKAIFGRRDYKKPWNQVRGCKQIKAIGRAKGVAQVVEPASQIQLQTLVTQNK